MRKYVSMSHLLVLALMLALLPLAGCSTPQTGVKYSMGKLTGYMDALPPQIVQAAKDVAEDLKLNVQVADATQLDGHFVATTALGKELNLSAEVYGSNISAVAIKSGLLKGDEALSLEFFNAIQKKLAGRARSASPPSTSNLNLLK